MHIPPGYIPGSLITIVSAGIGHFWLGFWKVFRPGLRRVGEQTAKDLLALLNCGVPGKLRRSRRNQSKCRPRAFTR